MQRYLNRIRANYPLIPVIANPNGTFGADTKNAVQVFQNIFNLTPDGIIGRSTWFKIVQIYVAITKLASLDSEGERIGLGANPPTIVIREGSTGPYVIELQFLLNFISAFYSSVPPVIQDGVFRSTTTTAVRAFQRNFNIAPDGIVGPATWNMLYNVFKGIDNNVEIPTPEVTPPSPPDVQNPPFPGYLIRIGARGENVRLMQEFLNVVATVNPSIPTLVVDGLFGPITDRAVREFQRIFGLLVDGIIGPITWEAIVNQRNNIVSR